MKVLTDTSVIIDGRITSMVKEGELDGFEIIIPEAVIAELEAQANKGKETGMSGLEEIGSLRKLIDTHDISMVFKGNRPDRFQVKYAEEGEIDAMVRDLAEEESALLMTSDMVQAKIAKAKGIRVKYLKPEIEDIEGKRWIRDYFDEETMSVHLRVGTRPKAKKGTPGNMRIETIEDRIMDEPELRQIAHEIIERTKRSAKGFIEMDKSGATIVQLGDMRIVISRPPFSDGFEITAVKPVARVDLDEYRLSEELKERIAGKRRGVMLAGAPGAGKSTLAQAVAIYLMKKDFVVKTMEKPRDLQVPDDITQYTDLGGSLENTSDVLLLVRPDYTIFDEVRKTPDFKVFADMRLAGVGMVGVTHANRAIDALQRLIGRVELGMVPQVVDTIIFVEAGEITKVYDIKFTVKVPSGMVQEDLARPVIEVCDFETGTPEYEIYTYGEQVVVMPVEETSSEEMDPIWELASYQIQRYISQYVNGPVDCDVNSSDSVTVYVMDNQIPALLGKGGQRIAHIEQDLGVKIDVKAYGGEKKSQEMKTVNVYMESDQVVVDVGSRFSKETVDLYADGEHLTTATVGRDGTIKIRKNTHSGKNIIRALNEGKKVKVG